MERALAHTVQSVSQNELSALFIYPAKSYFLVRLQIFPHAGCNILPPEELQSHAKNDVCGY